ncbi:MAG: MBL fold metallo-hydrolase [Flavobacterium sp.]|nr:MBL fold metallo-hydrolase [Flavobacterium sp.]
MSQPNLKKNNIDLLIVTHLHPDHIDPNAIEILDKNIKTITTTTVVPTFKNCGFTETIGLEWRDTFTINKGDETLNILALKNKA